MVVMPMEVPRDARKAVCWICCWLVYAHIAFVPMLHIPVPERDLREARGLSRKEFGLFAEAGPGAPGLDPC